LFGDIELFQPLLEISIYIIAFITLNNLFLSKLRADDKSVLFTFSGIVKIIVMIAVNIYLIAYRKFGIEGVLYAQLAGEALQTVIIIPYIFKQLKFNFDFKILVPTLNFGFPLIFSAMAINLLNGSDRYLLNFLTNETVLGLYELGYKVAGVVNMFVIMPFGFTLMPLAYKLYKKKNDKFYYKKIKTYAAFIFIWSGLALSLFSKEIIMIFASDKSYYHAFEVVPLIVLAYVFYGISMISSLGMHLTGNNKYAAYITIFCAGLNIGLNFWLIPIFGMMGAALNTVIAYIFLDIFSNIASNRYYKIQYEYFKLIRLITLGILIFIISLVISDYELLIRVLFKSILILIFPIAVIFIKYFDKQELDSISGGLKKWWNPLDWKKNIIVELSKTKNKKNN
jgi:O-antigen/teichoic acid export membrane protein